MQAMCFLLMRTTGLAYVGKGHQQHINAAPSLLRYADAVRGVCAPESSSLYMYSCKLIYLWKVDQMRVDLYSRLEVDL